MYELTIHCATLDELNAKLALLATKAAPKATPVKAVGSKVPPIVEEVPPPVEEEPTVDEDEPTVDEEPSLVDEARALLAQVIEKKGREFAKKLMVQFGSAKLSEVSADKLPKLIATAKKYAV